MIYGKTAAYTILRNERKYIDKWLYYAAPFDYQVLLDTGSNDGSYEYLLEKKKDYPNLIVEQKIFEPWRFDVARRYNLDMVPYDVIWALSPDLDEYYSINTVDEMERIISNVPNITCIACDRLDIYSRTVRVGPPHLQPTNKIHLRHDYTWNQPIYEHIAWKHKDREELELYSDDIFLIHDQDFKKKERSELYVKMMEDEYRVNPKNTWTLWFLVYHYYKSGQKDKYIPAASDYLKYHHNRQEKNYTDIRNDLTNIYKLDKTITSEQFERIEDALHVAYYLGEFIYGQD